LKYGHPINPTVYPALIAYFKFDEASGPLVYNHAIDLYSSVGFVEI